MTEKHFRLSNGKNVGWPLLLLALVVVLRNAAFSQAMACPGTIEARQALAQPVQGWEAFQDDLPLRLSYVTFYDGPPSKKASLVDDSTQRKENGRDLATWRFPKEADRHLWLACRYGGTSVVLARELPDTVTSCLVVYNPRQEVAGMPVIEKIDCK